MGADTEVVGPPPPLSSSVSIRSRVALLGKLANLKLKRSDTSLLFMRQIVEKQQDINTFPLLMDEKLVDLRVCFDSVTLTSGFLLSKLFSGSENQRI